MTSTRRAAVLGGNRIPFARSDRRLRGGVQPGHAHRGPRRAWSPGSAWPGERLGEVVAGAVLKHSRDFNLTREAVLGSSLSPHTPAYDIQQACGTGLAGRDPGRRTRSRSARSSPASPAASTPPPTPRSSCREKLRRKLLRLNRAKTHADRLKAALAFRPADLGVEIPANGEPRTGLSMGEHAAITAKRVGHHARGPGRAGRWPATRTWPPPTTAASSTTWSRPYLGLTRDKNLRPDSTAGEARPRSSRSSARARRRHDDGRQLDAADRRRVGGAAGHRGVGRRARAAGAGATSSTARPPRSTTSTATRAC